MEITLISESWYDLLQATIVMWTCESDGPHQLKMPACWMFSALLIANDDWCLSLANPCILATLQSELTLTGWGKGEQQH